MKRGRRRSDYRMLNFSVSPAIRAAVVCGDRETTRPRCIARDVG